MGEAGATLRRLAYTIPVVWLVVSVVFLLIHLVPGDPIQQMLGEGATASAVSLLGMGGLLIVWKSVLAKAP